MNKNHLRTFVVSILAFSNFSAFAEVEQVTALTVTDPGGLVATIDQYQASIDNNAQSVTLLAHMHDGVDPSTHTVVAIYDDLGELESAVESRINSPAWATLIRSLSDISSPNSVSLAMQKRTWGDDTWEEGGYLAAVLVNAANSASWLDAMDAWNRANQVDNPGMVRIVKLRGAPANHAVLIAASEYADLINYMESVEASDEFAELQGTSEAQIVASTYYRVAKVWRP